MTEPGHLAIEDLAAYAEGSLDSAKVIEVEAHLRCCQRCLLEVVEVRNLIDLEASTLPGGERRLVSIPPANGDGNRRP